jgi:transcriptional regulator with XRE-family HTH domain
MLAFGRLRWHTVAAMNGLTVLKAPNRDVQAEVDPGALGARIIELRKLKGWTQRELARRAKLRSQRLSALEVGGKLPRLDESVRLAGVLGVKLDELVFGQAELPVTQELVRELEAVGTREEMAGLGKLLQLLLLGYQRAAEARP